MLFAAPPTVLTCNAEPASCDCPCCLTADKPHPASAAPQVKSLHKNVPNAFLDCHLCTVHPENYVDELAASGGGPRHGAAAGVCALRAQASDCSAAAQRRSRRSAHRLPRSSERLAPHPLPPLRAGARQFTFHIEAPGIDFSCGAAAALAARARALGMLAGIALKPETPVDAILPLLGCEAVDTVLLLAVRAGFGGQKFNPAVLPKVAAVRAAFGGNIIVDGGITLGEAGWHGTGGRRARGSRGRYCEPLVAVAVPGLARHARSRAEHVAPVGRSSSCLRMHLLGAQVNRCCSLSSWATQSTYPPRPLSSAMQTMHRAWQRQAPMPSWPEPR